MAQTPTEILRAVSGGQRERIGELVAAVYEDLRALARHHMRAEPRDHALQATAIVHEVYLRLIDQRKADWRDRAHFFALASSMIRRVLVDHARGIRAEKRGRGWERLTLSEAQAIAPECDVDIVAIDEALDRLHAIDERRSRIVELRFFGGLTLDDAAGVMDISPRTARRLWASAKAWLFRELAASKVVGGADVADGAGGDG